MATGALHLASKLQLVSFPPSSLFPLFWRLRLTDEYRLEELSTLRFVYRYGGFSSRKSWKLWIFPSLSLLVIWAPLSRGEVRGYLRRPSHEWCDIWKLVDNTFKRNKMYIWVVFIESYIYTCCQFLDFVILVLDCITLALVLIQSAVIVKFNCKEALPLPSPCWHRWPSYCLPIHDFVDRPNVKKSVLSLQQILCRTTHLITNLCRIL